MNKPGKLPTTNGAVIGNVMAYPVAAAAAAGEALEIQVPEADLIAIYSGGEALVKDTDYEYVAGELLVKGATLPTAAAIVVYGV